MVVGPKVAHALRFASDLPVLERDQLTDEVERVNERVNELQVKALGDELARELWLGERHSAALVICWLSKVAGHAFF